MDQRFAKDLVHFYTSQKNVVHIWDNIDMYLSVKIEKGVENVFQLIVFAGLDGNDDLFHLVFAYYSGQLVYFSKAGEELPEFVGALAIRVNKTDEVVAGVPGLSQDFPIEFNCILIAADDQGIETDNPAFEALVSTGEEKSSQACGEEEVESE